MDVTLVDWGAVAVVVLVLVLALAILAAYGFFRHKKKSPRLVEAVPDLQPAADKNPYSISYVPSDMEWSGSTSGTLPLKTLTYKQYECLEDARYGFKIIGVTPTERKKEQPHKTRAHGLKTVASLARHGFLIADGAEGYAITDHGLNALEVCDVRY
jgi:hypothetical protein